MGRKKGLVFFENLVKRLLKSKDITLPIKVCLVWV